MANYLDTRDLYKRQCELQEELDALEEELEEKKEALEDAEPEDKAAAQEEYDEADGTLCDWLTEYKEELDELNRLENEVGREWMHGCTLIYEDDFKEYAMDLADDLHGDAVRDASWPFYCIDWDQAAEELKSDYSSCEYEGTTYLFRE